jgi:hypothetical protein
MDHHRVDEKGQTRKGVERPYLTQEDEKILDQVWADIVSGKIPLPPWRPSPTKGPQPAAEQDAEHYARRTADLPAGCVIAYPPTGPTPGVE